MKHFYLLLIIFLLSRPQFLTAQTPCTGAPASNTVIASSTNLCPGSSLTLSLQNPYTTSGIVYQWVYSGSSAVGPWNPLNGANSAVLTTNTLSLSGWYTCVIACQNSFQTTTATAVFITVGATNATTNIPYYENFENPMSNGLPNCAWSASSLGQNCISFPSAIPGAVPCSGQRMLGFSYSLSALGTHEFFTQGINLQPAVIYSVAVWQTANNYFSANNWSQFGIGVGSSASAASGTVVYSTNNPVVGPCTSRSATFTVPSTGIYYLRLFATAVAGTTVAPYLTFDDLSLTVPCNLAGNAPSATLTAPTNSVCPGSVISLSVNAAASTTYAGYPATTISYTVPAFSQFFSLLLTNTLTQCNSTRSLSFIINPVPNIFFTATPLSVCAGKSASLTTFQNVPNTFTLYPGASTGNSFVVTPSVTTNYTIVGTTTAGCVSTSSVTVGVHANPTLQVSANSVTLCPGQSFSLDVSGAALYFIGGLSFSASPLVFPPSNASTVYTVLAYSANGCPATTLVTANVDACTGFQQQTLSSGWSLSPNPCGGRLTMSTDKDITLIIVDYLGKTRRTFSLQKDERLVLDDLSPGIYYVRDNAAGSVKTVIVTSNPAGS